MIKPTLIYVYDPLCGWCYGFHPVMDKLAKRFDGKLDIEVKTGGLAVDDRAQTISEGYSFIKDATSQVEKTTGITFGRNFKLLAEEGSYFIDSVPPCLAQISMNTLSPENSLRFAGDLQSALFKDGKDLNEWETYDELLNNYDVDKNSFKKKWGSEKLKKQMREEFAWCKKVGATGFPTLLLKIGDETSLMTRGFRPYDVLESHLHHLINNLDRMTS
ncbi:MAG: DsbA family protein [Balneolaceae bacterium]